MLQVTQLIKSTSQRSDLLPQLDLNTAKKGLERCRDKRDGAEHAESRHEVSSVYGGEVSFADKDGTHTRIAAIQKQLTEGRF